MAVALVAAGLLAIAVLIPRFVAGAPPSGGLSPAFMPFVAASLATLSALAMAIAALRARDSGAPGLSLASFRFLASSAVVLGVSYALMTLFGYVVGGVALVAGLLKLARVAPVPLAIAAIAAPIALWCLFVVLLSMPLP
jgi:hypothetical protein